MSTKNKDIIVGKIEIDENEFSPQHTKIRVTTMLDEDALVGLKEIAQKKGVKYQTLLNKIVRSYVHDSHVSYEKKEELTEEAVRKIVKDELKKRRA